jgi:diaminohydroxyphosphoribosylaminopyrimidine deaminase / 5-amino-6-(5-phosphoribosylamino)uracil reductase
MTEFTDRDREFMQRAIALAEKGRGRTSPNPMVGAVIVKDGNIISEGYHRRAGQDHAEIDAIKNSRLSVSGSTMYVSLEPCTITGKTPPCADVIIRKGFKRVVIGSIDPNPEVNGSGVKKLREAGIEVSTGLMEDEVKKQNEVFFRHIRYNRPFICAKIASSIDGKLAAKTSDSKWITCIASRKKVQELRTEYGCVLTGINTVLADNPTLFPKYDLSAGLDLNLKYFTKHGNKKFTRAILDTHLRISTDSAIIRTADRIKTVIFTGPYSPKEHERLNKENILRNNSVFIEYCDSGKWTPEKISRVLYRQYDITSLMVEAGPGVLTSFLKAGAIDKFNIFIAPKVIGGDSGFDMFKKLDTNSLNESIRLTFDSAIKSGDDVLITAYPAGN